MSTGMTRPTINVLYSIKLNLFYEIVKPFLSCHELVIEQNDKI